MNDAKKTRAQPLEELEALRGRVAELQAKLAHGDFELEQKAVPTLADYSRKWLITYAQVSCRERMWRSY